MSNKIRVVSTSNVSRLNQADDAISACKENVTGMRILIVDDDKNSGESLRDIIRYRGHDVTLLDEGMKFVNRMNEERFDLILMDYHTNEIPDLDQMLDGDRQEDTDKKTSSRSHNKRNISMTGDDDSDVEDESDTESDDSMGNQISDPNESEHDEITGTYVTNLARECYGFDTPVFAYTGDNSSDAIQDFQDSNFKGVLVKPVDVLLINSFFDIIEHERESTKSLTTFSPSTNSKLRKLAMKNSNFIFFRKGRKRVI